jgi:hypothetical protein
MATVSPSPYYVNPVVDATIDATDTGHRFGYEDATEGRDQAPSAYFVANTPAWHAYNEGYKEGCVHLAVLTGESRPYVALYSPKGSWS